jgi:hypothetical protein
MSYYQSIDAPPLPEKRKTSNWIKFGIPVAVLIIAGAVVGGIFASRSKKSTASSQVTSGSSAGGAEAGIGIFPTATDSEYLDPLYPSTVRFKA